MDFGGQNQKTTEEKDRMIQFEKGDLAWVLGFSGDTLCWALYLVHIVDPDTCEVLLNGRLMVWDRPFFKTKEEAEAALTIKMANLRLSNMINVQPMTAPSGTILSMEYEYKMKVNT